MFRQSRCAAVDARSMRDTTVTSGALTEHVDAVGSDGCDHKKEGPC